MTYQKEELDWLWLASIEGIGPKRFYELTNFFGNPTEVRNTSLHEITRSNILNHKVMEAYSNARNEIYMENLLGELQQKEIDVVTAIHPDYPVNLTTIFDPPPVLYVKGNLKSCTDKYIAIVGSRQCTRYGQEIAEKLGYELASQGITVVSGLARGIDTHAHIGCLRAGGKTIAVLGCGVDIPYPPENRKIYQQILETGILMSEYIPGTKPLPQHFPARNRIISGIASGVVVVEAGEKSGAMITVDYALEQGREVFAVPGNIFSKYSIGTNQLMKEGAKIVTKVSDIIEEFGWHSVLLNNPLKVNTENNRQLDIYENMIMELLEPGSLDYNSILNKTGLSAQYLNSVLTILEIQGIIKQLPGKIFSK